jgi:plasmid stability protein
MRRKVSTVLDEALVRAVKVEAARQGRQVSEIYREALERYLGGRGVASAGVVAETWGAIRLDRARVREVMATEDSILDP